MRNEKTKKLVMASLFASLCCVLTITIQIPLPTGGYVNLGDTAVLLSGWILGPVYGGAAAGIGSMLADIFTGYTIYALPTLIVKGSMAVVAALLFRAVAKVCKKIIARIASAVVAECIMVGGYFLVNILITGSMAGAAAGVPGNLIQALFGIVGGIVVIGMLNRNSGLNLT